jgi:hypothetical protein
MSKGSIPIMSLSVTIGAAALLAHRAVTLAGAYPAAGAFALGVLQSDGAIGSVQRVDVIGTTVATAGAAFAADVALMVDATGRLIAHTGTNKAVARSMEAATAADQLVEVLLTPSN